MVCLNQYEIHAQIVENKRGQYLNNTHSLVHTCMCMCRCTEFAIPQGHVQAEPQCKDVKFNLNAQEFKPLRASFSPVVTASSTPLR